METFLKILSITKQNNLSDFDLTAIYMNIGSVYMKKDQFAKGAEYLEKGLEISETINGRYSIYSAMFLNNLGAYYVQTQQLEKALNFFERSLFIKERIEGKKSKGTSSTYNNIGKIYFKLGDCKKAIENYEVSIEID